MFSNIPSTKFCNTTLTNNFHVVNLLLFCFVAMRETDKINDNLKKKQWEWIKGEMERGREISSLATSNCYKFNQELRFFPPLLKMRLLLKMRKFGHHTHRSESIIKSIKSKLNFHHMNTYLRHVLRHVGANGLLRCASIV